LGLINISKISTGSRFSLRATGPISEARGLLIEVVSKSIPVANPSDDTFSPFLAVEGYLSFLDFPQLKHSCSGCDCNRCSGT
jgi:hypothetical protein